MWLRYSIYYRTGTDAVGENTEDKIVVDVFMTSANDDLITLSTFSHRASWHWLSFEASVPISKVRTMPFKPKVAPQSPRSSSYVVFFPQTNLWRRERNLKQPQETSTKWKFFRVLRRGGYLIANSYSCSKRLAKQNRGQTTAQMLIFSCVLHMFFTGMNRKENDETVILSYSNGILFELDNAWKHEFNV